MTVGLAVDTGLVALIATMIGYCVVLDRRLARLRGGQADMSRLVAALLEAIGRAETSLAAFRSAGAEDGARLGRLVEQARSIGDELAFLAERGERCAERLAEGDARTVEASAAGKARPRSRVERDLADAMRSAR
ncbi:MAG: DUF6468 domain-containing protein [Alphaproteobacteria bacterium]